MSENSRPGREPFERWTLKQDFCNLTWSQGACYAGANNLVLWSEDFSNAYWTQTALSAAPVIDPGDTVTTSSGVVLQKVTVSGAVGGYINVNGGLDYPVAPGELYQVSGHFRTNASAMELIFNARMFNGTSSFNIQLSTLTNDPGFQVPNSPFADIIDYDVVNISGDDYRAYIIVRVQNVNPNWVINDARIYVKDDFDGYVGGYSLSRLTLEQSMAYRKTTDETITNVSSDPCFNTRATCQVPDVYDLGELPIKFCKNQQELPRGEYHIPMVASSRITPGSINPGGSDANVSAMGKRATINVTFKDAAHSDLLVDPYRDTRSYDPKEQGTFWTKWRARNPYYMHRELVYESGYLLDGAVVDSIERTFFVTGFSGPDASGNVTISGHDVLTLAANDKAKAPFVSTGKSDADLTAAVTSITLTPTGIGDLEYDASGYVRIGKEVMSFTRAGDVLTVVRGQYGTEATTHKENDSVQQCLVYTSAAPADILYELLNTYAGVPASFLDKTQWDAEQLDYLPRLYSTIITEPEGVNKLVAEMCQQMYFTTWFDERESLVKMRAVRPAENDTIYELNDDLNLVEDSIQWTDKADELITQVWVYYGQINPTEKLDQGDNYAALDVIADPTSEAADRNNLSRIKVVYSRWIDSANGAAAIDLGNRILARYGSAPRECTFKLDAKDRDVWLADFVRLTNRLRTDFYGNQVPVNMQVFEAQESVAGTTFTIKAKEYVAALTDGDEVQDPNVRNIIISADQLNVNLRTLHDSQYAAPTGTETVTCIIRSGVTIGGYAADPNVNIPYVQRDTSNDFYAGGTGSVSGLAAGQIPILQRRGIVSQRTTASGAAYPDGGGNADFIIEEYPISTAFDTGTWPVGVTLNLVIEAGGRILGEGGNGSTHGLSGTEGTIFDLSIRSAAPGGDGGHAMNIQYDISITNGGVIRCGSGGGGPLFATSATFVPAQAVVPGGGGSGLELSDTSSVKNNGFSGTIKEPSSGDPIFAGPGGQLGNLFFGGRGGGVVFGSGYNGDGAAGQYNPGGGILIESGQGGVAGDAIASGADMVTWVNKGDVRGAENI